MVEAEYLTLTGHVDSKIENVSTGWPTYGGRSIHEVFSDGRKLLNGKGPVHTLILNNCLNTRLPTVVPVCARAPARSSIPGEQCVSGRDLP